MAAPTVVVVRWLATPSTGFMASTARVLFRHFTWKIAAFGNGRQMSSLRRSVGCFLYHDDREDSSLQERVRLLAGELNCQEGEVRMALQKYPRVIAVRQNKLLHILAVLRREGIVTDEILTYPDVFTHSLKSLTEKIDELKRLDEKVKLVSLRESNLLFGEKIQRLKNNRDSELPYETKEELLMARLGCSEVEASELLQKHNLITTKLSSLKTKLDLLRQLPVDLLVNKLWVLRFPVDALEYRLKLLNVSGVTYENCGSFVHLLSCEEKHFDRRLRLHLVEKQVLGECSNTAEYLQKRLKCDAETISSMVKKNPKLLSISAAKLKAHLDLLESKNFMFEETVNFPRIFNFSVDTIKSRCVEMRELNLAFGIRELALENSSYRRYVDFWRKKNIQR